MKSPVRAILIWAFAASVVLSAQSRLVPAPDASFGFKPGADYKLATYDQSVDYFRKLAAASKYVKLVEAGKTSQGRHDVLRADLVAREPAKIDRYREIAQRLAHPAGADRRRGARARARRQGVRPHRRRPALDRGRRRAAHAAAALRPRQPRRTSPTSRRSSTTSILMLWPTINPDGQQMVAEWYMKNVGTPYELSGLPQLYQEYVGHDNNRDAYMLNMIESRVHRAHVAAVGAADHLRAPPVAAVSDAHLAAAVLRAGRHRRAVPHVARSEHDRHGDRQGPRGARPGRRDAHGHGVRRLVSRLRRLRAELQEHRRRSGPRPRSSSTRRRTSTRSTTFPQNMRDLRPQSLYSSPWPPGLVAAARRGRLHGDGVARRCSSSRRSTRTRCSSIATRPAAIRSRAARRRRRSPTSSRRSSAIRSRPSSCCAASRSAACASRS